MSAAQTSPDTMLLTVLLKHEADAQRAKRALGGGSERRSGNSGLSSTGGSRPSVPPNPFGGMGRPSRRG